MIPTISSSSSPMSEVSSIRVSSSSSSISTSNSTPISLNASTSESALVDELLKQRRYSFWCENHRMYDLRRYNLSSTLPIDRPGDQVFNQFPVPLTENE